MGIYSRTRKDGTTVYGVDYYDPDTRKRVKKRIGSKRAAEREYRLIMGEREAKGTLTGLLALRSPRFGEWAAAYLRDLCFGNTVKTREHKRSQVAVLTEYFDRQGLRMSGLSPLQVKSYVRWRLEKGNRLYPARPVTARTVNMELQLLRHLWNCAKAERKVAGENPVTREVLLLEEPRLPVILAESDFQALLAACRESDKRQRRPGAGLHDLVLFLRYTGCRWASEALPLRLEDVNGILGHLAFRRTKPSGRAARSAGQRVLPLTPHVAEILNSVMPVAGYYFGGPGQRNRFRMAWGRARTAAGLPELRLHDFRHMASSQMQRLGVDPLSLEAVLGHKLPGMLGRYGHATIDGMQKALMKLAEPFPGRIEISLPQQGTAS